MSPARIPLGTVAERPAISWRARGKNSRASAAFSSGGMVGSASSSARWSAVRYGFRWTCRPLRLVLDQEQLDQRPAQQSRAVGHQHVLSSPVHDPPQAEHPQELFDDSWQPAGRIGPRRRRAGRWGRAAVEEHPVARPARAPSPARSRRRTAASPARSRSRSGSPASRYGAASPSASAAPAGPASRPRTRRTRRRRPRSAGRRRRTGRRCRPRRLPPSHAATIRSSARSVAVARSTNASSRDRSDKRWPPGAGSYCPGSGGKPPGSPLSYWSASPPRPRPSGRDRRVAATLVRSLGSSGRPWRAYAPPSGRTLATAGVPLASIRNVVVTHRHMDHVGGMPALFLANQPLAIYGSGDAHAGVRALMAATFPEWPFHAEVAGVEVAAGETVLLAASRSSGSASSTACQPSRSASSTPVACSRSVPTVCRASRWWPGARCRPVRATRRSPRVGTGTGQGRQRDAPADAPDRPRGRGAAAKAGARRALLVHIGRLSTPDAILAEARAAFPGPVEVADDCQTNEV